MDRMLVLKAIADETRMKILSLLLRQRCCVRALAKNLARTEATVSQHLKVLREAGLLNGEKRGHFMHYDVERQVLRELAGGIEALADIEREDCAPEQGGCHSQQRPCHAEGTRGEETKEFCHGKENGRHCHRHGD